MVIIFVIVGALIGAGFASGQEIYVFFYKYSLYGILGLIICSILTGIVIYKTFSIILYNKKIHNYKDFLEVIFKNKGRKKSSIINITNFIINISLLMSFFIMISGFGAYFEQEFNVNKTIGSLILAIACFLVFMTSVKGVTKVNTIVVPVLMICILIIGMFNIMRIDFNMIGNNLNNIGNSGNIRWFMQGIIYCSYNMLLIIPVLVNLKDYIKNKKQITIISIFSGIIVFILAMSIYLLLVNVDVEFKMLEMPTVYVISKYFSGFRAIYGIVILLSIFTTAISVGISFLEDVIQNKKYFPQFAGIMCITGVMVSNFGFSNLVNFSFPICGYLGLFQIICIWKCTKNRRKLR